MYKDEGAQHKPVKHIIYNFYDLLNERLHDKGPFPMLELLLLIPIVELGQNFQLS